MRNFLRELIRLGTKYDIYSLLPKNPSQYQRFILPNGGFTEDGNSRIAIEHQKLYMPFPKICLEYQDMYDDKNGVPKPVDVCVFCEETMFEGQEVISMKPYMKFHNGQWGTSDSIGIMRDPWHREKRNNTFKLQKDKLDPNAKPIKGVSYEFYVVTSNFVSAVDPSFVGPFCYAITGLLNVLACSNVSITKKTPKIVRGAKKVLPYDSYWVLELPAKCYTESNGVKIEGRLSPREHVRRGHIRHVHTKDGRKPVWINSMIVNPGVSNRIVKDYRATT
jgi:hypothetical protein